MMGNESAAVEKEEAVPEHLRCSRRDGKKSWRCPRRVVGNMKQCEFHRLKNRQYRKKYRNNNKMKKKPKLASDRDNVIDMEGEGEGEGEGSGSGSTTVDLTGYDLKNRICKLEKLIAKLKADKLSSKV